jgi:hypothetical protein
LQGKFHSITSNNLAFKLAGTTKKPLEGLKDSSLSDCLKTRICMSYMFANEKIQIVRTISVPFDEIYSNILNLLLNNFRKITFLFTTFFNLPQQGKKTAATILVEL